MSAPISAAQRSINSSMPPLATISHYGRRPGADGGGQAIRSSCSEAVQASTRLHARSLHGALSTTEKPTGTTSDQPSFSSVGVRAAAAHGDCIQNVELRPVGCRAHETVAGVPGTGQQAERNQRCEQVDRDERPLSGRAGGEGLAVRGRPEGGHFANRLAWSAMRNCGANQVTTSVGCDAPTSALLEVLSQSPGWYALKRSRAQTLLPICSTNPAARPNQCRRTKIGVFSLHSR